ncbi:hypothetical protein TRIUR3_35255 [Triticum urartu]|uniref:Late embryogenesis abundant protein LEA-2 subgroup domain-containing protein n=2 Tax=Triticum urartu TaxID=4572 RepID=M7ZD79_TRIUA|nr:hypothetical protein TRIUR3_35255 [Triticum urartu]
MASTVISTVDNGTQVGTTEMNAWWSETGGDHHHHEDERSAEAGHRRHRWKGPPYNDRQRRSPWVWMAVILCMLLAIGVLVLGATMLAVYLIYKPQMPYMEVTNAQLLQLDYSPADGVIRDIKFKFDLLAKNTNSKVDTSFSSFNIDVNFNGTTLLQLSTETFTVARESSVTLPYSGESRGTRLDPAGMQPMEEAVRSELVPITLSGKARTRWKKGVFLKVGFWTRLNCPLDFYYRTGNVAPIDHDTCRSRSP